MENGSLLQLCPGEGFHGRYDFFSPLPMGVDIHELLDFYLRGHPWKMGPLLNSLWETFYGLSLQNLHVRVPVEHRASHLNFSERSTI